MLKRFVLATLLAAVSAASFPCATLRAETGAKAWLRYARLDEKTAHQYDALPATVVILGNSQSPVIQSAQSELLLGISGTLGRTLRTESKLANEPAILLATPSSLQKIAPDLRPSARLIPGGFWLARARVNGQDCFIIAAEEERGLLYGVFALTKKIALGESVSNLNEVQNPSAPIRWVDQWDNLDGSIERGYAGRSIFFDNGQILADNPRIAAYARLLASVGINGCTINNVNANPASS